MISQAREQALTDSAVLEVAPPTSIRFTSSQSRVVPAWSATSINSSNVGSSAFCQSTLVRKLNTEDYAGACAELLRWRFFQGKDCALPANARLCGGLATRRQAEYRQCIGDAS